MTIIVILILVLLVLCFAVYFFRGNIETNEKKSIVFKLCFFSFSAHHEKKNEVSSTNTDET